MALKGDVSADAIGITLRIADIISRLAISDLIKQPVKFRQSDFQQSDGRGLFGIGPKTNSVFGQKFPWKKLAGVSFAIRCHIGMGNDTVCGNIVAGQNILTKGYE